MALVLLVLFFGLLTRLSDAVSGTGDQKEGDGSSATSPSIPAPFSHEMLDRILVEYVDEEGWVDYAGLSRATTELDRYIHLLGILSPKSHPEMFPSIQDQMAYWINAYNAFVLRKIAENYPAESVLKIKRWRGFFWMFRFSAGNQKYTLKEMLNNILCYEFHDPRIHFVLNWGARSAPLLERKAFTGADLDARLERAARRFIRDPRNVKIDRSRQRIWLSPIFDWYAHDFRTWYMVRFDVWGADILDYVKPHLPEEDAKYLTEHLSVKIEYYRYDWGLNDRPSATDRTTLD